MPEVEITRKQVIVVDEVGTNSYGDLTWTDKEGKSYKVKSTRTEYFKAIVPGQAIEISFATYKNREYPYSVTAVKDKLPTVPPTDTKVEALDKEQTAKAKPTQTEMSKNDWAEKDRITRKSIERQTALKEATEITCAMIAQGKEMSPAKTLDIAKLFEAYLEGDYELMAEATKLIKKGG